MSDGGKGSAPRPFTDYDEYAKNWDQVFGNKALSPCKHVCKLDETGWYCTTCYRNVKEISNWCFYSDEQKTDIMRELDRRKAEDESRKHLGSSK
jgi:predicted Fe-S protein YdhL (DUF1289 family)